MDFDALSDDELDVDINDLLKACDETDLESVRKYHVAYKILDKIDPWLNSYYQDYSSE